MAIRNDLTIDWTTSPRIIEVASPSTSISMQDLLDTLRFLESQSNAMSYPPIIDASGKEILDATTRVAITVAMQNAKLSFQARLDWTTCECVGGNMTAVDVNSDPIVPTSPTSFVNINYAKSASATLSNNYTLGDIAKAIWDYVLP